MPIFLSSRVLCLLTVFTLSDSSRAIFVVVWHCTSNSKMRNSRCDSVLWGGVSESLRVNLSIRPSETLGDTKLRPLAIRRIPEIKSSEVEAFVMYPEAPERNARAAYSQSSCIVSTRIDTTGFEALIWEIRSMPSRPGIDRSATTTLMSLVRSISMACA